MPGIEFLPPGLHFKPTDEQIVGIYLPELASGASNFLTEFPDGLIKKFDIFSTEPWNLPHESFRCLDEEKHMHFFTPRYPTTKTSRRASRTAGSGFWHGCGKDVHIFEGSQLIGHKTQLNFVYLKGDGKDKKKIKTDWIMHEFRLHSSSHTARFDDMALCRIHLKKKNSKNKCSREEEQEADSSVYDAVSISQQQQVEEEIAASMPDNNETASCEQFAFTEASAQPAPSLSPSSSSSWPSMPSSVSWKEPQAISSKTSDVEEEALKRRVVRRLLEELTMMTANGYTGAIATVPDSVGKQSEEEVEGRMGVKRTRVEEDGSMADNGCIGTQGLQVNTTCSSLFSHNCMPPPSVTCKKPVGLVPEELEVASIASAAIWAGEQEEAEDWRLRKRRRVEEREHQQ